METKKTMENTKWRDLKEKQICLETQGRFEEYIKEQLEGEKMVDATQAMESSFVDVDLIRASTTKRLVVVTEGEYTEGEYQGRKYAKLELDVEIDGKKKKYAPNRDSVKNISQAYTPDTKRWVGKVLLMSITKINGKDCLIALPITAPNE
jgi:hypothetical protein